MICLKEAQWSAYRWG